MRAAFSTEMPPPLFFCVVSLSGHPARSAELYGSCPITAFARLVSDI